MSFVLFVLAAAAAAAGIMMIGFGIPINEFSLGNTLIIAGTTALTGAAVIAGLAVVSRQIVRLNETLASRPAVRPAESLDLAAPVARGELPPRAAAKSAPQERSFPALPSDLLNEQAGFAPPRSAREPAFEDIEEAPLSPRTQPRGREAFQVPESGADRRGWRPPGARAGGAPLVEPPAAPPLRDFAREPARPAAGSSPRAHAEPSFESAWPNNGRDNGHTAFRDPPARPNGSAHFSDVPQEQPQPDPAPVSVLKSGIVDGMAYTLYTDGSIEAELAQGVVRFGSIEELRNHLEKSS